MPNDQRLIEDYIPIEAISAEARREKSIRKGHISTLHLWWARRPLVAARAAVYGALMPAPQEKKAVEEAEKFVKALCTYPGPPEKIEQARRAILEAHAARLSIEQGSLVTLEDIEAGRAPRPRVLDMFAGGGSIPLEALRLGCEAYALDLNPVAHIIELCTLVYPQQFGKPDPAAKGCAPDGTWAGLAKEVEHWGKWVLDQAREEIGDLYPPIPDPDYKTEPGQPRLLDVPVIGEGKQLPKGWLMPVAYLWTRTVRCSNPACGGVVPLARQTWLAQKKGRYVALRLDAEPNREKKGDKKTVVYQVVKAPTIKGLGFDPEVGSVHGNIACPFCGTVATRDYIKAEGKAGRINKLPMVVVSTKAKEQGKIYLGVENLNSTFWVDDNKIIERIKKLTQDSNEDSLGPITIPDEPLPVVDARGAFFVKLYGFEVWGQLFSPRQLFSILVFTKYTRRCFHELSRHYSQDAAKAIVTYMGIMVDRLADYNSSFCRWHNTGEKISNTYARQALPMVWDYVELNPFGNGSGNALSAMEWILQVIQSNSNQGFPAHVQRGSASSMPFENEFMDAVITDPPYYDNVPYSDLSDFFYVWLKRSLGFLYPEHFSTNISPKKQEAIMDAGRHKNKKEAHKFYEQMMGSAFVEAGRLLKPKAPMIIVYAHKTTAGWATLVDALRKANFMVTEAWPLDTEMGARLRAVDSAALASSIFLVARRREGEAKGSYEQDVQPELKAIVRERLDRLWAHGVSGADLVIACIGAGLRAFTRYACVEYANGAEVPAEGFLAEVEGAVLDGLLEKLFGVSQAGVAQVDVATRFYILWRYAYHQAAVEAGEAIVFAYPLRVELDGPGSLSGGHNPLVVKNKGLYRLCDFAERGEHPELGRPDSNGPSALIDTLQRILWLVENHPSELQSYLDEVHPDLDRLRAVAQALAGPALGEDGGAKSSAGETAALRKLTSNWRSLVEENLFHKS